ncbi:hypothetical protein V7S43_005072 [Phytophthora oleae]|uniref:SGNH hydrolase-type esterase domain-containing protein n=1 Tax=Phytophthora oleae TaxID=2107226 RepID=A0ABD3FTU2_9STRA
MALSSRTTRALLAFFTLSAAFAVGTSYSSRPVLLLTGDSLTEQGTYPSSDGWVSLLQAQFTRSADVITRGLSGYNTKWFLKYVVPALEQETSTGAYPSPSLITIWLGTNDAVLINGSNSEMHVPIGEFKANLGQIVRKFQTAAPEADILMITPTHIDDEARVKYATDRTDAKRGMVDRSNAAMADYARACVEVAELLNVPVLDLYEHFNAQSAEARNALLADGIHFNVAGNKVVYEQLKSKLNSDFPALVSALDVWQFPEAAKYVKEDPWTESNATVSTT